MLKSPILFRSSFYTFSLSRKDMGRFCQLLPRFSSPSPVLPRDPEQVRPEAFLHWLAAIQPASVQGWQTERLRLVRVRHGHPLLPGR